MDYFVMYPWPATPDCRLMFSTDLRNCTEIGSEPYFTQFHGFSCVQEKQRRDQEAAELDDEAARRRQRVALWQEQRRAAQQAEEAEAQAKAAQEAGESWTLEDDFENDYQQVCLADQSLSYLSNSHLTLHLRHDSDLLCI